MISIDGRVTLVVFSLGSKVRLGGEEYEVQYGVAFQTTSLIGGCSLKVAVIFRF